MKKLADIGLIGLAVMGVGREIPSGSGVAVVTAAQVAAISVAMAASLAEAEPIPCNKTCVTCGAEPALRNWTLPCAVSTVDRTTPDKASEGVRIMSALDFRQRRIGWIHRRDRLGGAEHHAHQGIFVADVLGSAFSPALIDLFSSHEEAVFDYISFRRDMEGLAAERAARMASDTDLAVITEVLAKMEAAHQKRDPADESELDANFHMAIIEASHNVVMLHMMRSMYDLLRQGVFYNRQMMFKNRLTRDMLLDQHRAINSGVQSRNPQAARAAVEAHLDYVKQAMVDQIKAARNEAIARQRLQHEKNRQ